MHVFLAILAFASFFEGQLSAVNAQVCIPHIFYEVLKPDNLYGVKSFPGGDLNACNCVGTHDTGEAGKNYVCRDPLLGPKILPKNPHLTSFVSYYNRFGGDAPGEFLKRWTINGSYIYPPQNGFQLDLTGKPILGNMTLLVGTMVDRFGSEYGSYVSAADAPYSQRALPPSNLDTNPSSPDHPYNYYVYEVIKQLDVVGGPIAPWFSQPGLGAQFYTGDTGNIMGLIGMGNLVIQFQFLQYDFTTQEQTAVMAHLNKIVVTSSSRQHPSELESSIASAFYDLETNIPDMKSALRPLQFVSARELEVGHGKKAIVIFVPVPLLQGFHKVQQRLTRELEKKFSDRHVLILASRRILPRPKRSNRSRTSQTQKRPRSRTLTAVHDAILGDLVYPVEIVGKRTRTREDGSKILKVVLDEKERGGVDYRLDTYSEVYRRLTGRGVGFEFPMGGSGEY
ncbi:40S ribosomal protein [Varicellaria rhodocarpa]|nr:40S ribosomal protein [Varicellaria rhodocarpa]